MSTKYIFVFAGPWASNIHATFIQLFTPLPFAFEWANSRVETIGVSLKSRSQDMYTRSYKSCFLARWPELD